MSSGYESRKAVEFIYGVDVSRAESNRKESIAETAIEPAIHASDVTEARVQASLDISEINRPRYVVLPR